MAVYSIKDLEKLSGIKAHTIRIWEQRYGIVKPQRTKTNIRYYMDSDLKLLLNVALLNRNGIKISKIAKMDAAQIAEKVSAISEINFDGTAQLDALTLSMIEMDELKFDRIISTNTKQIGFEKTMLEVIYPFLDKLSLLWLTGSIVPAQENFISNLIRQKIILATDELPLPTVKNNNKFLIYLPEGEKQELSMLFMHFLIKSRGNQVIYLGQNVGVNDVMDAFRITDPNYIFTMITETYSNKPVQQYVNQLSQSFPTAEILLSGYQVVAQDVSSADNIVILKSLFEAIEILDRIQMNNVREN
ncbi:MAG: MerR family transcriptional regulator [Bacteroidota bacterium]